MSITAADLNALGVVSRPKDDTSVSGGAIDDERRPVFTPLSANAVITASADYTSDLRTLNIEGRDPTGAVVAEALVLAGVAEVVGSQVFERIQEIFADSVDPASSVGVHEGIGGPTIAVIPANELGFYRLYQRSASEAAVTTRYEKFFWRNDHPTLTLNDAEVTLTVDPSTKIEIGLATAKDDAVSVVDRKTAPAGVTFVDDGVAIAVPSVGIESTLEAASAIGVWVQLTLLANDSPLKSTFTTRLRGTSV